MKFNSENRSGSRLVWSSIISPDNKITATGCVDGLVRLMDMSTGLLVDTLTGHTGQIRSLDFKSDGSVILSGSLDGTMRQWFVQNGMEVTIPINHGAQVLSCGYSSTGDTIISAGRDGSIKLWKNYKSHHYEDTLDCIVKYPLKVRVPDLYAKTGDFFRIQLLAESLEDIPNPAQKLIDFQLKLEYPARIIDFRDSALSSQTMNFIDTAVININSKQLSDTLANFLAIALFSSANNSRINILDFDITNSSDYYIEKDDGSITLSSSCEGNTSREIQFSNSALALDIYPQPAVSELSIEMDLIEKGNHVLQLYDIQGNFINEIINENYSAGHQQVKINTQFLQPGYYSILLKAPNEVKIKYVLIIR
jgi:WD40 repeat protein